MYYIILWVVVSELMREDALEYTGYLHLKYEGGTHLKGRSGTREED